MRNVALATVVLAIALAGTAGAAKLITGSDIKDGSISAKDLSASAKRTLRGHRGPQGPAGPQGPVGVALTGVQVIEGAQTSIPPGGADGAPTANCPAGKVVVGTGFDAGIGWAGFVRAYGSFVGGFFLNDSSITIQVSVQAMCAANGSASASSVARSSAAYRRDLRRARALSARR